ncbi:zinc carboxypeptidase [Dictyocaulus viviparus]|uniref:Zinc carboxypeptidase n=1 Tax=Dictyocaulus viviparus TaxID=29172 RepID=A0A0D8XN31_DICVI|nr:zinc carboxypeptidase [Dictyocaulus viviparus]
MAELHGEDGVKHFIGDASSSAIILHHLVNYSSIKGTTESGKRRVLLDVWATPSQQNPMADVLVAPEFLETFLALLRKKGITHIKTLNDDIGSDIRRERRHLQQSRRRSKRSFNAMDFDVDDYHSYDEMVWFMRKLAEQRSDLVQLLNITRSFEGRPLYGVKISSSNIFKPAIFVDAGIHAREWIAPAAALYMIKKLVSEYGKNPSITNSVDRFDWYIIPQANPDGYEYSRVSDRLWRKTRSRNITVNKWCVGADANRNWGHRWGEAGANRSPCSNIYAGSRPFSEPEIVGQMRPTKTIKIVKVATRTSLSLKGSLRVRNAASIAVAAMRNTTGATYNYGTIAELMYPASGTSIDYMQHRGVPYIFGVELRPLDSYDSYAFSLPPKFIRPTGELLAH